MISVSASSGSRSLAVLVRLAAFLAAGASVVVIPATLAAAAAGHMTTESAFLTTGVAAGLCLLTSFAARGLDPLRAR